MIRDAKIVKELQSLVDRVSLELPSGRLTMFHLKKALQETEASAGFVQALLQYRCTLLCCADVRISFFNSFFLGRKSRLSTLSQIISTTLSRLTSPLRLPICCYGPSSLTIS